MKKDKVKLLSLLNEKSYVPVVIKVAENKDMLINEIRATDIYNILSNKGVGQEYREPVVIE